jgi:1-acyl-sn-glycerol-3-phosphate acyltransferase
MILTILAKGRFHFMGKEELLKSPVFRPFFETIDIPVNRDSKMSSFRAFKKAGDNLDKGMSLIIFPEGKIDEEHYPPQLQSFKNGPFRLAITKKVDIIPVSIADAWKKMWDDGSKYGSRPGICNIYIHKPISTVTLDVDSSDFLREKVFSIIKSKVITNEHR